MMRSQGMVNGGMTIVMIMLFAACSKAKDETNTAQTESTSSIQIKNVDESKAKASAAPDAASTTASGLDIATQTGTKGTTVHLRKVKVIGQVLSIDVIIEPRRKESGGYVYEHVIIDLDKVNYIDDATAKKVSLLQDEAGVYMTSPSSTSDKGTRLSVSMSGALAPLNLKFPAPPESTQTISIDLSGLTTFDEVPVSR